MKKQITFILILSMCAPVMAEPVLYVCERPTWGNDEGCGHNKTRYSYALLIDRQDFSTQQTGAGPDRETREFVFAEARGCDLSRARGTMGRYYRTDKGFYFITESWGRDIELHTDSMQAMLIGAAVKKNPLMTCTEFRGDQIEGPSGPIVLPYFLDPIDYRTSPTVNVNSDRQNQ